ncbi:tRNA (adenosine(37)-N6)-threonylcarbamoyltransferase complex transferase subunit TsaD [Synechococcus sp. CBW1002]|uniref:tRNA (adenosine(37)-N6)-threonylcarbamoyltransferase complex transferase subunit TsaD n=1 Tax=unclassified Synechococcus TaxID=2626047 RepID=UPI0018CC909E|nr:MULTISPECIES: tRNA (adenosine(37)-N6)-threonylcarbamoyltransferase complex transferase subunit TsaD [unclassified Synechococcus]QPN58714.1 tRNA (adenosine(37)-N6)-threonylcarbamoyltransferase complex transferase subunit TsaD [Synechococcus sp. CBW1002]QPN65449.1 tRNA (adenosine(37)-N6)-threonylcarbamoyltransferase complex transferase subunit TsaD [Synechococcus sp. CBW1006]CAK6699316.1 tRNA N6-adenosine threonylcarbamoyltransferase [Synechococcus sp. CBW1107]
MATILALETSCDESAAAIVRDRTVLAHAVASQVEEHARFGGVVPEIASRRHVEALPQLIATVLSESSVALPQLDAVAATVAPGLVGALLVGSVTGRTLARLHGLPFLGMHHLEAHLCSVQLGSPLTPGPHLVLLVSGGHTELIRVEGPGRYQPLGRSHDDAAGEAFDKVARLLGLAYPGGPAIQAAAEAGDPHRFALPKGRVSRPEGGFYPYDFSFSGLKTAMLRLVRSLEASGEPLPVADLAASFEQVVADVLVDRSCRCARDQGLATIVLVGGVAANRRLRQRMEQSCAEADLQWRLAPLAFCTDNAAMVGVAAAQRFSQGCRSPMDLGVAPRLPLVQAERLYEATACF